MSIGRPKDDEVFAVVPCVPLWAGASVGFWDKRKNVIQNWNDERRRQSRVRPLDCS